MLLSLLSLFSANSSLTNENFKCGPLSSFALLVDYENTFLDTITCKIYPNAKDDFHFSLPEERKKNGYEKKIVIEFFINF